MIAPTSPSSGMPIFSASSAARPRASASASGRSAATPGSGRRPSRRRPPPPAPATAPARAPRRAATPPGPGRCRPPGGTRPGRRPPWPARRGAPAGRRAAPAPGCPAPVRPPAARRRPRKSSAAAQGRRGQPDQGGEQHRQGVLLGGPADQGELPVRRAQPAGRTRPASPAAGAGVRPAGARRLVQPAQRRPERRGGRQRLPDHQEHAEPDRRRRRSTATASCQLSDHASRLRSARPRRLRAGTGPAGGRLAHRPHPGQQADEGRTEHRHHQLARPACRTAGCTRC